MTGALSHGVTVLRTAFHRCLLVVVSLPAITAPSPRGTGAWRARAARLHDHRRALNRGFDALGQFNEAFFSRVRAQRRLLARAVALRAASSSRTLTTLDGRRRRLICSLFC